MSNGQWSSDRGYGMIRTDGFSSRCCATVAVRWIVLLAVLVSAAGCVGRVSFITAAARTPVDRKSIEYQRGHILQVAVTGLTAPTAMAIITDEGEYKGAILIAANGSDGKSPSIFGYKLDGSYFSVYPRNRTIPTLGLLPHPYDIYGPIGGMVVTQGKIFVTHKDSRGKGVVSAFTFDGTCSTVVPDLPAQGDLGVTDIAVHPVTKRLWFGVGAATNSGVVGLDNWHWVQKYPFFSDSPERDIKLLGLWYLTKNPRSGLFGGDDNVGTVPFQPFGYAKAIRVKGAGNGKPTAAIYSVSPSGGDLMVEATGLHYPRGLAFYVSQNNAAVQPYATNDGMELRGSRPVKDDPDSLLRIDRWWYGWPDYSTDLRPISDKRFYPGAEIMNRTSYPELSALIDQAGSSLQDPSPYAQTLVRGVFESQSGAAKFAFVPYDVGFRDFEGRAIVALAGDRAPFATGGLKLDRTPGYKIVSVNIDDKSVKPFIHNTEGKPGSRLKTGGILLERPIDIKYGGDGQIYILDFGQMEMRGSREKITPGTGKIFVLKPVPVAGK